MGSFPMRDGVHDFDANSTNNMQDDRPNPASDVKAGVEYGLSSVEAVANKGLQPEQETINSVFKQGALEYDAGEGKNGKSFKFKY
jgi:hypothetical protein